MAAPPPGGTGGDATADCLAALPAGESACNEFQFCTYVNSTSSRCACARGRTGEDCLELLQPLLYTQIFDGVFYLIVFILFVYLARRLYKKTQAKEFQLARARGATSHHVNMKLVFVYRIFVLAFCLGVHLERIALLFPVNYVFYTVWNFIALIVYFGIGAGLSGYALWKGPDALEESKYWRFNTNLHYILLEIELPNTLIVDFVTWALLLPSCGLPCPPLVNFSSLVQHLINFFFIAIDWVLCTKHAFDGRHWFFTLLLTAVYATFHLFLTIARDPVEGHLPIYFFLDGSNPFQPLWIIGVLIIHVVMFTLVWAFSKYILKRRPADDVSAASEEQSIHKMGGSDSGSQAGDEDKKSETTMVTGNPQYEHSQV